VENVTLIQQTGNAAADKGCKPQIPVLLCRLFLSSSFAAAAPASNAFKLISTRFFGKCSTIVFANRVKRCTARQNNDRPHGYNVGGNFFAGNIFASCVSGMA
jgi:hypothetical protein